MQDSDTTHLQKQML